MSSVQRREKRFLKRTELNKSCPKSKLQLKHWQLTATEQLVLENEVYSNNSRYLILR